MSDLVLVVSEEPDHRDNLAALISHFGLRPLCSRTSAHAAELIRRHPFSAILCDDVLLDGIFGAVGRQPAVPVIVVSRQDDWSSYLRAMRAGAFDYLLFPFSTGEVERILQSALLSSKADCHPGDNSSVAGACFAESYFKSGDVEGGLSRQTATELLFDAPEKTRRDALLEWLLCLASALQTSQNDSTALGSAVAGPHPTL